MQIMALLIFLCAAGCSNGEDACKDVNTSQAPKSISTSGSTTTYYWENGCSRIYSP